MWFFERNLILEENIIDELFWLAELLSTKVLLIFFIMTV